MDPLLRRLRRLTAPADPDGRLLARYAATGDPVAVEELVRRHGPTVWAAARRRLPDPADAADVFQATFLVLLQKGGRLTQSPTVGPWLYRVAALTARNLRRKNARRLAHRRPFFDVAVEADGELRADLDDALLTLSERDRSAVVLCHLQGYSRREAAERLGLPEGTLSSVLSRALAKLRRRLDDDPLPLLAAGSLTVPAGVATAATNAAAVVRVASLTAAAGPEVVSLTREAMRMFWLKKLAAGGMAVAACLGLGVGVGLAPQPAAVAAADPPKAERHGSKPAEPPKPLDEWAEWNRQLGELNKARYALKQRIEAETKTLQAQEVAEQQRIDAEWSKVRRLMDEWEAARPKPPQPAVRHLRVEVAEFGGMGGPPRRVIEVGADGKRVGEWGAYEREALRLLLRRTRLDPDGPKQVVLVAAAGANTPWHILEASADLQAAGFTKAEYTGPLPLVVGKGGRRWATWSAPAQGAGEAIDLAERLPAGYPDGATCKVAVLGGLNPTTDLPIKEADTLANIVPEAAKYGISVPMPLELTIVRKGQLGEIRLGGYVVDSPDHPLMREPIRPDDRIEFKPPKR